MGDPIGEECELTDGIKLPRTGRDLGVPATEPGAAYMIAVLPEGVLMRTGTPICTGEGAEVWVVDILPAI